MGITYHLNGGSLETVYASYKDKISVKENAAGEAHCALLVQHLTGAPLQSTWKKGKQVRKGSVTAGTAVATFNGEIYDGTSGTCHAAIFIKEHSDGIEVWDQWKSGHFGQRKLDGYRHGQRKMKFRAEESGLPNYKQSNDGDALYVIET